MSESAAPRSRARATDPARRRTSSWAARASTSSTHASSPTSRTWAWPRAAATWARPSASTRSSRLSQAILPRASPADDCSDTTSWPSSAELRQRSRSGRGLNTTRCVRSSSGTARRRSGSASGETRAAAEVRSTFSVTPCTGCRSSGETCQASSSGLVATKTPLTWMAIGRCCTSSADSTVARREIERRRCRFRERDLDRPGVRAGIHPDVDLVGADGGLRRAARGVGHHRGSLRGVEEGQPQVAAGAVEQVQGRGREAGRAGGDDRLEPRRQRELGVLGVLAELHDRVRVTRLAPEVLLLTRHRGHHGPASARVAHGVRDRPVRRPLRQRRHRGRQPGRERDDEPDDQQQPRLGPQPPGDGRPVQPDRRPH